MLNQESVSCTAGNDVMRLVNIKITSSANRLILWSCVLMGNLDIWVFILICSAKGSISRLKIRGDRGHPCLVSLVIWKGEERILGVYTRTDGVVYRAMIALRIWPLKPNLVRTEAR